MVLARDAGVRVKRTGGWAVAVFFDCILPCHRLWFDFYLLALPVHCLGKTMLNITIRSEQPDDIDAIAWVTKTAFAPEQFASHTEQFIVNALRRTNQLAISLVALYEGTIVGHIAISPVSISSGAPGWYGLGPVSVLPQWQGQGVGTQLIRSGLAQLQRSGARGCVVLGDPQFYGRFGFKANCSLLYAHAPAQYFQALAFAGEIPCGQVSFHEAFEATQ